MSRNHPQTTPAHCSDRILKSDLALEGRACRAKLNTPGSIADDGALLELLDRRRCFGAEHTVDNNPHIGALRSARWSMRTASPVAPGEITWLMTEVRRDCKSLFDSEAMGGRRCT
jgi:hypothetical protein